MWLLRKTTQPHWQNVVSILGFSPHIIGLLTNKVSFIFSMQFIWLLFLFPMFLNWLKTQHTVEFLKNGEYGYYPYGFSCKDKIIQFLPLSITCRFCSVLFRADKVLFHFVKSLIIIRYRILPIFLPASTAMRFPLCSW